MTGLRKKKKIKAQLAGGELGHRPQHQKTSALTRPSGWLVLRVMGSGAITWHQRTWLSPPAVWPQVNHQPL